MEFLIVLGSGVLLLGLGYLIWMYITKQQSQGTPNWPNAPGTIAKAKVYTFEYETPRGIKRTYTPLVRYSYDVEGKTYFAVDRNVQPYYTASYDNRLSADMVTTKYEPGSSVTVYYNPANPAQSLLEVPKPVAHNAVLYYGLANALLGVIILILGIVLL